ncbi:MAG TPA: PorP/SprF family type IX secretion system membrane protein, partial [Chitinophagaceae bacterium]|nr:PorP/SprF family type IX secretion system membrane protein [Chitinophagaceae bacterium]
DGGFNYMSVSGSAAYRLLIDRRKMNVLSIGIQAGIISRRFDPNKLKFGEQWNPVTGYDPGAVNGEMFDQTSSLDFDANIGIVYYNRNPNTSVNPFGGVSVYHLTRPYDPFYKHSDSRLPMRINLHGGARIKMGNRFVLTPQLIYLHQGKDFGNGRAHELVGSLYAQYMLGATADLLFGATYRLKDAAVPFVGFHVGDFTLGFSYDVNVSKLNVASLSQGGMEISLTFINHKEVYNTDFVCPRL